jgi:hypothetical protein
VAPATHGFAARIVAGVAPATESGNDVEAALWAASSPYHRHVFSGQRNITPVTALVSPSDAGPGETAMKHLPIALGLLAAAPFFAAPAQAQNYPWCEYITGTGGARNCGFVNFEQCMESARGNGGDCRVNTLYTPPPGPHPHAVRKPKS